MAEIINISRFTHKSAIIALAGLEHGAGASDLYEPKSIPIYIRGFANLRKTLF